MKKFVGKRLPKISPATSKFLVGSLDFLGINHYTTLYARNDRSRIRKLIVKDAIADAAVITSRKMLSHNLIPLKCVCVCCEFD
jgi:beta-glucosidase